MGTEKREPGPVEIVFTTAQLVWLDLESGDEFEIEVVGAAPWVHELTEQGFTPSTPAKTSAPRYRCRIEFTPDPA
ncbi:MAG: hypothetical protein SGI72_12280 [Planctomycetota bacterium]|nr:hypothetical protein [Planctomycetota bacterium]